MIFHKQIENIYKAQLFGRCDDRGLVNYFSHKDFPGMKAVPYCFPSLHGHTLKGYFYSYEGAAPEALIIFEHGFGGGHRSYMKEIERLCAAGYRVLGYDHTGCMESGGEGANGFAQSLCDLDDCIKALKKDGILQTQHLYVMGHSWGGYSTLNIAALHPEVEKIVVLAGVTSVKRIIAQNFSGILKGYRRYIMALETAANPYHVGFDAVTTLQNAQTKALLIYSDNDQLIRRRIHYDALYQGLHQKEGIEFLLESSKGHNPNYTADAVAYLGELGKAVKKAAKLKTSEEREAFKNSFDWHRMTAQDDSVWQKILDFLK